MVTTTLRGSNPHAAVIKKFFNQKANGLPGQTSSTTLATLAENKEEAFGRRFYNTTVIKTT